MDAKKGWETSLQDIEDLIHYSEISEYHFKRIIFSGGEPLLWSNLEYSIKLIKRSRISDDLYMYTNALAVNKHNIDWFKNICSLLDGVIVSKYENNKENIDLILKENIPNVSIINRDRFYILPKEPIENTLPADCRCAAFGMIGDIITLCSFQDHMIYYQGWNPNDFKDQTVKIGENYLDKFENVNPFERVMCSYCFGNMKVKNEL